MAKDFYQFMKKKDGEINIHHIAKYFPNITKETFLVGMGKWLDDKGLKHSEKLRALDAMDKWWIQEIEKYRNRKQWFKSKQFLKRME